MDGVERDVMFVALTRPQMFAGVTYSYFVANAVLATEIFLIFHTLWALVIALVVHVAGMMLCLREPRFFDLWLTRVGRRSGERRVGKECVSTCRSRRSPSHEKPTAPSDEPTSKYRYNNNCTKSK